MNRTWLFIFLLLGVIGCRKGPGQAQIAGPVPPDEWDNVKPRTKVERPKPPLELATPPDPPAINAGKDFSKLDTQSLRDLSDKAYKDRNFELAIAAEFWAIKKGRFESFRIAECYAELKNADAAYYWLQRYGLEVRGIERLNSSEHLFVILLRQDKTFEAVDQFLKDCVNYWRSSPRVETLLFQPKTFDRSRPSPVLVCLDRDHGHPDRFPGHHAQAIADSLTFPVICISGTYSSGPNEYEWAWTKEDGTRIDNALKEIADRVVVQEGKIVLLGHFEGGQTGLEVAARFPDRFAGAIAVRPFTYATWAKSPPLPKQNDRRYVIAYGTNDFEENVYFCERDRDWMSGIGAEVNFTSFPADRNELPGDFVTRVSDWVAFILEGKK